MARIYFDPLDYQQEFMDSRSPKVLLSTGYGGGKTYVLCMKAFQLMTENRGMPGGLLCPNMKMFHRDVLPTFEEICNKNGIRFRWFGGTKSYLWFPATKSRIYVFHAEDKGTSIRGPNLAFMLINEVSLCDFASFNAALARVRLKAAPFKQLAMSGTPEGFTWTYNYFIADPREDSMVIYGDMRKNTHVAPEYAQMLLDSYDDKLAQQYVEGKYLNVNALAALYAFDRHKHTAENVTRIRGLPIWVTLDFNINPMAATLWNRMPIDSPYLLRGFGEIRISGADTYQLCDQIRAHVGYEDEVVIFPDPAGRARSTKVKNNITDITILEEHGAFTDIRYKSKIKSVRDCLNAANAIVNKGKIILDTKACKYTISDFEQTSLKPGTTELDKTDPDRTHWVDGFKNMAEYEFPITVKAGDWRNQTARIR